MVQRQLWPGQQVLGKAGGLAKRLFCLQTKHSATAARAQQELGHNLSSQQGQQGWLPNGNEMQSCKQLLENTTAQCKLSLQSAPVFPLEVPL